MSTLGNVVASAVAPAGLQAQQVARARDQQHAQASNGARRVRDLLELHLRALEEDEAQPGASPAEVHIDEELPQHQQQGQEQPSRQPKEAAPKDEAEAVAPPPPAAPAGAEPTLYRHVDIQA
jgi:hypothetical protein